MTSDTVEICPWMTDDYFKSILTKYEGHDNLQLLNFTASGMAKGENFASSIYRIKLTYLLNEVQKQTTLILKTKLDDGALAEMLGSMDTFKSEAHVYENILAECEKLTGIKTAPRLIHFDNKAMVLEDLSQFQFSLANRKNRFDLQQTKVVIEKLAKFHAATAVIHNENPDLFKYHLVSAVNSENNDILEYFFNVSYQSSLDAVRNVPEFQKFVPKLESFEAFNREKKVFTRSPDDKFHVLNHGDMWTNNIFIKTNENDQTVDCQLVDFQECFWGSPGIDLNHFLYSCCSIEVHEDIEDVLLFYYKNLKETLQKSDFPKIPSFEDIKSDFKNKSDQALIATFTIVPVLMLENIDHANPEYFLGDSEEASVVRAEVFGNPKFLELLKSMLPKIMERIH